MTERADRSIDIQTGLFEKSLDLQTRLFDKTMSTLESIGRSTGVTEQRMSDILSFFQNPSMMKEIAGRAVEETTVELGRKGKEGVAEKQTEAQLAERLTQNIVRELSTRIEGVERAVRASGPSPNLTPTEGSALSEEQNRAQRAGEQALAAFAKRVEEVRKVIRSIPGAEILEKDSTKPLWDIWVAYKGKKLALDLRLSVATIKNVEQYDRSAKEMLFQSAVDCLVFVFLRSDDESRQQLEERYASLPGKIKFVFTDPSLETLLNDLLATFESVAAALPLA